MPSKFRSLQRQIEEYLVSPKMERKSPKTKKTTKQTLMRGARALRDAGLELNPKKMRREEMIHLRDKAYGGEKYNRNWNMTFWAGFMKYHKNNVFEDLDCRVPKCSRKNVRWLSEDDDLTLWEFIFKEATPIQRAVLTLESGLGLRRIEILRLKMSDIQNDRIHVLGKGSNGGKPRALSLDGVSTNAIGIWLDERARIVSEAKNRNPACVVPDSLFIHLYRNSLRTYSEGGIDKLVKTAAKEISNTRGRRFAMCNHDLRRTMGRRLWKDGTRIETISRMLGHVNPIMTMQYLGINDDDMKAASESSMEKMMRKLETRKEAASA